MMSDTKLERPSGAEEMPQDANVGWVDDKSQKKEEYRAKASDYDLKEASEGGDGSNASGPRFDNVDVYWTVGSSGAPSSDVQNRTAITWYKLSKAPWYSPFSYELSFNTRDTYNYYFQDSEPDSYNVNVYQNAGTHFVQYNSDSPTIVKVSGN